SLRNGIDLWRHPLEIEDIQQLRWKQGIEDLEPRAEISGLQVGDSVNLTFRADKEWFAGETLVRITSIKGSAFRGKLAAKPALIGLANLRGRITRPLQGEPHSLHREEVAKT